MRRRYLLIVVASFGALVLAPLFAMASGQGYCEKWKGREFLSSSRGVFESRGSQCMGYCALALTDVSGPVARWEITGQWCSTSARKSRADPLPERSERAEAVEDWKWKPPPVTSSYPKGVEPEVTPRLPSNLKMPKHQ